MSTKIRSTRFLYISDASSYKIWFPDPKINKDKLLVYLKSLHIAKIEMNDLTNTATIIFKLKSVTRDQVVQVLSSRQINIAPQAITDVNECKANSIACHGNKICQNTDGSFKCACANGYKEEETGCVSTSSKFFINTIFNLLLKS